MTHNTQWMEEVKAELNKKANIVGQFEIAEARLKREQRGRTGKPQE